MPIPWHDIAVSDPAADTRAVRVPIGFPPDLYEWLCETAYRRRTRMAELFWQAVREYRDRNEPQLRLPMEGRIERRRT